MINPSVSSIFKCDKKSFLGRKQIWVGENKIYSIKFKALVMAAVCILLPGFYLAAQSSDYVTNQPVEESTSEKNDGAVSNELKQAENQILLSTSATSSAGTSSEKKKGGMSTFLVFLRMIIVLAIVLAIIWIIFKLLQKTTGASSSKEDQFLRKVASLTISPGKTVQVVTLVDRAFLIGVADNSVNLLCEIEDPELISAMNLYAEKNTGTSKPKNFSEVLEIFMPKKKKSGTAPKNVFDDGAAQQILNSLKKQSDRMNRGE